MATGCYYDRLQPVNDLMAKGAEMHGLFSNGCKRKAQERALVCYRTTKLLLSVPKEMVPFSGPSTPLSMVLLTISNCGFYLSFLSYLLIASFPLGKLNLVSLFGSVQLRRRKDINTVMSSFPHLEEIFFSSFSHEFIIGNDRLSVQELQSLLIGQSNGLTSRFWSKVYFTLLFVYSTILIFMSFLGITD